MGETSSLIRKWCRNIHREASYICSGILLVYATSGFVLNLKTSGGFNPENDLVQREVTLATVPTLEEQDGQYYIANAETVCSEIGISARINAVYEDGDDTYTAYFDGGSTLRFSPSTGVGTLTEKISHPVLTALNNLHYNRPPWWGAFSHAFLLILVLVIVTGLVMVPGKRGMRGRGGWEFTIGIAIPILFMILS